MKSSSPPAKPLLDSTCDDSRRGAAVAGDGLISGERWGFYKRANGMGSLESAHRLFLEHTLLLLLLLLLLLKYLHQLGQFQKPENLEDLCKTGTAAAASVPLAAVGGGSL